MYIIGRLVNIVFVRIPDKVSHSTAEEKMCEILNTSG